MSIIDALKIITAAHLGVHHQHQPTPENTMNQDHTTDTPNANEELLPKPQVDAVLQWRFTLNKQDTLLVLKALGGRLHGDEEWDRAEDLCRRLTTLRATAGANSLGHLDRAAAHAEGRDYRAPRI